MTIRCTKCKIFNYWFQNSGDLDMKEFMSNGSIRKIDSKGRVEEYIDKYEDKKLCLDLVFFRSIN